MMQAAVTDKLEELTQLLKTHQVKRAYAFGSVCTDKFTPESDIDLLIAFQDGLEPLQRGEHWWSLFYALRSLLGRNVDLLVESDLQNPYLIASIEESKQRIYG